MMQKIAIKVEIGSEQSRRKAMKIASAAQGVLSVEVDGEELMVVTGNGVDPVCLTNVLRKNKRFRNAKLLTVEEMDDANNNNGVEEEEGGGGEGGVQEGDDNPNQCPSTTSAACACKWNHFPPQCPTFYVVAYDDPNPSPCSVM